MEQERINPNKRKVEVKTLAQAVGEESDNKLAALLNDGWQMLGAPGFTSVTVAHVTAPGWQIKHFELVKLWRKIEQQPSEPLKASNYSSVVERINTARETVICGLDGGPPTMRKPLDEVTFLDALQSGQYTAEEISMIGDRENAERFFTRIAKRQAQQTAVKFAPPPTNKRTPLLSQ